MLDLDPANLADEVTRAEEFRRKHTQRSRDIVRRFVGNWYRMDNNTDPTPDNLIAGYVAFMLPELAYTIPSCSVDATRPVTYEAISDAMEMMLRQWLKDSDFGDQHQDWVRDAFFGFGAMKVGLEPKQQFDDGTVSFEASSTGALTPFACRIPPDQFIMDPRCETPEQARYMGHTYWKDLDNLQSDPRWDAAAVEQLSSSIDDEEGSDSQGERAVPRGKSPERNRIGLVDLWLRETKMIITLGRSAQTTLPVVLRQVPFHGPSSGPYQVLGFYRVPGDPYPIGPLQFAMEQFEELQAHVGSASEAAGMFKRFLLVDAGATDVANATANARNGDVCTVRGLNPTNTQQVELGGANPEQYQYIEGVRDRWDRTMGLGDAQRGMAAGKTATESQIVQSNVDGRTSYMKSRVTAQTAKVLNKVAWYMFHDPNIVAEVSQVDPITGQVFEGLFLGGIQPGQEGLDWTAFNLEITPESMSRTDNQVIQARAMQIFQLAPQALQMMVQMPAINVRWILKMLGESMNLKALPDLLFNPQVLAQLRQVAMAGGIGMGANPPGAGPQQAPDPSQQFNAGLGFANAGQSIGQSDNSNGFARPAPAGGMNLSPSFNGPAAGAGGSPLPQFGMARTNAA